MSTYMNVTTNNLKKKKRPWISKRETYVREVLRGGNYVITL